MLKTPSSVAVAVLLVCAAPAAAEEVRDATVAAPAAHSVVFENDHVRVISAMASAGHKSPMHSHPRAVVISMDTARIKVHDAEAGEVIVNMRPGTVFWSDGATHEWELLAGEINAIAVEIKTGPAAEGTVWPPAVDIEDSVTADPGAHSVVFENDYVRVISGFASDHHKATMHSHPSLVVVQMDTGRVKLTPAGGEASYITVQPGMVFWLDNPSHEWELVNGNLNAIGVEVKGAQGPGSAAD